MWASIQSYKYVRTLVPWFPGKEAISMASLSSLTPPTVPVELYVTNREKLLSSLRHHLSQSSRPIHGIVFLQVIHFLLADFDSMYFHKKRKKKLSFGFSQLVFDLLFLGRRGEKSLWHWSHRALQVHIWNNYVVDHIIVDIQFSFRFMYV